MCERFARNRCASASARFAFATRAHGAHRIQQKPQIEESTRASHESCRSRRTRRREELAGQVTMTDRSPRASAKTTGLYAPRKLLQSQA
eukprot:935522-Pleurochrysis_carterae.AAC.1